MSKTTNDVFGNYTPAQERRALDRVLADVFRINTGTAQFAGGSCVDVVAAIESRIAQSAADRAAKNPIDDVNDPHRRMCETDK